LIDEVGLRDIINNYDSNQSIDRSKDFSTSRVNESTLSVDRSKDLSTSRVNKSTLSVDRSKDFSTSRVNESTLSVDWTEILSGGERQRLAIVRALYDNPSFCILDEATSAMSNEIEEKIYKLFLDRGITIVSIVHKESLKKFHKKQLNLLGDGQLVLSDIN
jgi:ABC-type uncharacterized transport system fused permease/ATPase subunit